MSLLCHILSYTHYSWILHFSLIAVTDFLCLSELSGLRCLHKGLYNIFNVLTFVVDDETLGFLYLSRKVRDNVLHAPVSSMARLLDNIITDLSAYLAHENKSDFYIACIILVWFKKKNRTRRQIVLEIPNKTLFDHPSGESSLGQTDVNTWRGL